MNGTDSKIEGAHHMTTTTMIMMMHVEGQCQAQQTTASHQDPRPGKSDDGEILNTLVLFKAQLRIFDTFRFLFASS